MQRYDQLFRLYDEFAADTLRAAQEFLDVFPPLDSPVARAAWTDASEQRDAMCEEIADGFPATGDTYAEIAANATRDQAFTALDLYTTYERAVNVLVLDIDETLRSAGNTDNEIPRETLHLLTELHESGVPIVVCTGQTLENVKGFLIQGLGNELVHSGELSVVYETGTGVFTPGHGPETKQLLYEDLDEAIRAVFERVREGVLSAAPERIRRGCHLQGNEFNVTLKPNFDIGSEEAVEIIDAALEHLVDLLGEIVVDQTTLDREADPGLGRTWVCAYYASRDPEIAAALDVDAPEETTVPDPVADLLERIDLAYYEGDAAEITSSELNKTVGVRAAFDALGIDDPFALVMGDSKSDLRVMRWIERTDAGIAAAPMHASGDVLEHARQTDELVFSPGEAGTVLRTVYALNLLASLE